MRTIEGFKKIYRDMSAKELHDDTQKWKKQIKFLQYELTFFEGLLDANIYNPEIRDLYETLQLYKKEINNVTEEGVKIINSLLSHEEQLKTYFECDDINFDYLPIEIHTKMAYDVAIFLEESNNLKIQLIEYIESTILK